MPDRILIYGVTGSGKSTLAARVATVTGLPWHDVDDLTWRPGWVQLPEDEQRRLFATIAAQERWILDTAYGIWRDVVVPRADLIVALDYPRWTSLTRLVRRTVARVVDRRPICHGNVETLRSTFSRESIITWHFTSFARKRRRIREWDADPAMPVVRLTSPRAAEHWLRSLADTAAG